MTNAVKGTKRATTANSQVNALAALIESMIRNMVNTTEVVMIKSADDQGPQSQGGRASAIPLVSQTDGFNNALPVTEIFGLPFYRPQAGKAAILMRPQPGDKAVMVCAKRDSSGVDVGAKDAVPPGSYRIFDQADGFLVNGFLGQEPEIWLLLDPETGDIELSTKTAKIGITCRESGDIEVSTAAGMFTISGTLPSTIAAPLITLQGNVMITGGLTVAGPTMGAGGAPLKLQGGMENTSGNVKSNGVILESHTHGGVYSGSGNSGPPNTGT